ncbi:MAG: tetraacyldisaccharide 4'-kinase [Rhizobiaceae bacterium]|nr:tetraacyldisaccharide 4'-kinase [Rhizobiaceae bacterium]
MATEAPPFWWTKPDWRAYALYPASFVYGQIASYRLRTAKREPMDLPVLCVGNLTVGGAGKTPVAIALARRAERMRLKPGFLSRGYGGSFQGPHVVDLAHDSARTVGDEPLLLAEHAPVAVTPDRAAGARLLASRGCDFLIMDDGFQSARIQTDYALLVVDGERGVGNGHVIPGGPLRAPLVDQMRFADAVLKMGQGSSADDVVRMAARAGKRVFEAESRTREPEQFQGRRFLAFAGIGNPQKFFASVAAAGGEVVVTRAFPDHHFYTAEEIAELRALAAKESLETVTTAKDAARLAQGSESERDFARGLAVLRIDAVFDSDAVPRFLIEAALEARRQRKHKPLQPDLSTPE